MKTNAFKKTTTKECAYCDFWYKYCRKGHKCSGYKKYVKTLGKARHKKFFETS